MKAHRLLCAIHLMLAFAFPTLNAYGAATITASSGYRLFPRDLVSIAILGEPEMSIERRIDGDGRISLPLIGQIEIRGLSTVAAEAKIAQLYIDNQIFIRPQISLSVKEYYPREVFVLGQVREPGKISLPIEATTISIVEAITKAGGFTRISKSDSVQVTRRLPDGSEQSFTVNVSSIIEGKGQKAAYDIQPDDVIFVPERIF